MTFVDRVLAALTNNYTTFTPTIDMVNNVSAATPQQFRFVKIGNIVHFSGYLTCTVTAPATLTTIGISLPSEFASNFNTPYKGAGVGSGLDVSAQIVSDTSNDNLAMSFTSVGTGVQSFTVTGSYEIN